MNQQELEKMIKDIMSGIENTDVKETNDTGRMTYKDYPLGEKSADKLRTPTGKKPSDITIEGVMNGDITSRDVRITPETLEYQAQVAESMGRDVFASNLRRAAELIAIPDERILEIYNALRPYRSTKQELLDIATELETKYNSTVTSALVREAAEVGEMRGRLKRD